VWKDACTGCRNIPISLIDPDDERNRLITTVNPIHAARTRETKENLAIEA
jgi:hypothetical protein